MNNPESSKHKVKPKVTRLKPSERDKERYVAYEIASKIPLGYGADKVLISEINALLGLFMAPKANLASMKYNPEKQRGIIRIHRKFVEYLRSCFAVTKHVGNQEVVIKTLKTSGMIDKVKKYVQ
jgi:RNase P/RNase MRP subunit POP5